MFKKLISIQYTFEAIINQTASINKALSEITTKFEGGKADIEKSTDKKMGLVETKIDAVSILLFCRIQAILVAMKLSDERPREKENRAEFKMYESYHAKYNLSGPSGMEFKEYLQNYKTEIDFLLQDTEFLKIRSLEVLSKKS
jgi:hypothetical protein